MDLQAILKEIGAAKSISHLRGIIEEFIQEAKGITSFSYLVNHYSEIPYQPQVITHYPASWIKLYKEKNYLTIDPIVQDILTSHVPFVWNYNIYLPRLSEQQTQLFLDSANHGVTAGVTCPLHGPMGEFGGVFFAIESVDAFVNHRYSFNQWELLSFAFVYHETARRLITKKQAKIKRLTLREAECLMWSARGKTAFEISIILGLAEQTVETYLKSCISKLDASNKTHAVVKAMLQAEIAYQDVDWSKAKVVL